MTPGDPAGPLYGWGYNGNGNYGNGTTNDSYSPVQVGSAQWKSISVGWRSSAGVQADGTLWNWGDGIGTSPVQVGSANDWKLVTAGKSARFAIKSDGTLWAWGIQSYGELMPVNGNREIGRAHV